MASMNIGEEDFLTVALAANKAKDSGNMEEARKLDKIARKMNAALTAGDRFLKNIAYLSGGKRQTVRWQDMPSTIEED